MATSTHNADYFSGRPAARARPSAAAALGAAGTSPRSPRTPQPALGRSISAQFGSPGAFREQEDVIVYNLDARYFTAGFAGESRPRCVLPFTPDSARRVGDHRPFDVDYIKNARNRFVEKEWNSGYELYQADLRELDLGLIEDKLDRALRTTMINFLQLDVKPRKAVLVVPSLLPTPLLDIALKVLFGHFTQPPSIALLTQPIMCCVSAGLRHGLVIDIGWEETVVTAVGEYKEIAQRRSTRAGKLLTREMGNTYEQELQAKGSPCKVTFKGAEDLVQRMAWCRKRQGDDNAVLEKPVEIQVPGSDPPSYFSVSFTKLSEPAEKSFFANNATPNDFDDHDIPLHLLAYNTLLALPLDLRAICVSRIVINGQHGSIPGLKRRLLQEIAAVIESRGWDPVSNYGSANGTALQERSANISSRSKQAGGSSPTVPLSPSKKPMQESVPHANRVHDDVKDPITLKAEREATKGKVDLVKGVVRGVETLGPWAGASLVANMRIKGVHEIDRDDFLKHGLRGAAADV